MADREWEQLRRKVSVGAEESFASFARNARLVTIRACGRLSSGHCWTSCDCWLLSSNASRCGWNEARSEWPGRSCSWSSCNWLPSSSTSSSGGREAPSGQSRAATTPPTQALPKQGPRRMATLPPAPNPPAPSLRPPPHQPETPTVGDDEGEPNHRLPGGRARLPTRPDRVDRAPVPPRLRPTARDVARLLPLLLMEYRRRLGELRQQFSKLRLSWGRCMGSLKASLAGGNPRLLLGCLCWRRS
jgi:hypothetical protein